LRAPARLRITADRRHWIHRRSTAKRNHLPRSDKYTAALESTRAAAAIAPRRLKISPHWESRILRVDDADLAVAKVLRLFAPPVPRPAIGVDPAARVALSPTSSRRRCRPLFLHRSTITPGSRCVIHANVFIGDDVSLGENCEVFPGVVIRERITIGNRVVIHAAVSSHRRLWLSLGRASTPEGPQVGTVIIEDDVEIGSCVCIDRAKFSATASDGEQK